MRTVYAAQNRINYIVDFLQERIDNEQVMYEKSRTRYQDLLDGLNKATSLLCKILEIDCIEQKEPDTVENTHSYVPGTVTDPKLLEIVNNMKDALHRFEVFTSSSHLDVITREGVSSQSDVQPDSSASLDETGKKSSNGSNEEVSRQFPSQKAESREHKETTPNSINHNNQLPIKSDPPLTYDQKLKVIQIMEDCIDRIEEGTKEFENGTHSLLRVSSRCPEGYRGYNKINRPELAIKLGKMMTTWYDVRVRSLQPGSSQCRYNAKYLPVFLQDIVMTYGEAIEKGKEQTFENKFYEWIDDVKKGNKYMVPFSVYRIQKDRWSHVNKEGYRYLDRIWPCIEDAFDDIWGENAFKEQEFTTACKMYRWNNGAYHERQDFKS